MWLPNIFSCSLFENVSSWSITFNLPWYTQCKLWKSCLLCISWTSLTLVNLLLGGVKYVCFILGIILLILYCCIIVTGSLYGYMQSDPYDSMICVLRSLTEEEKQNLVNKVQELVGSSALEALTTFIGNQVQRELLLNVLQTFLNNKGGG